MTTLNALKRSFFIVQPRNGSMSGGYSELARAPKGSILTLGLNWSPIVKDIYDTTVSSSLWSQSGNTVSVVNADNDDITTQIDVTVHAEGKTVLENKVTLANGIVLVHYIIVQGIDLNKDVTSVAVPVDGSGLDFDDTFATLQVDGVTANTVAPTLDFDGTDFAVTEAPDNDFDISINTDAVTFAKMQNIATDTLIGRVSSGTGDPEEVTCTDFAQSLLDDTDAATARATLGLGSLAAFSTVVVSGQSDVVADAISDSLTLVAGSNITITTDASTDSITITSTGGGTPGGSDGQIQYNNAGAFGGDSGFTTDGAGSINITGDLDVDNLNVNGNTLSSTNTDGNIVLDPNGTGTVNIDAVNITGGSITGITDLAVADGGTGRSSATAYAVVCGGTTATGALQSIADVGTSGQVLTSNGAGALPTFQSASGGGVAWTLLEARSASGTGTHVFDDAAIGTANEILVIFEGVVISTSASSSFNWSIDGGSTWTVTFAANAVTGTTNGVTNPDSNLIFALSANAYDGYLLFSNGSLPFKPMTWFVYNSGGTTNMSRRDGLIQTSSAIDAIRLTSSESYTGGTVSVYYR